MTTPGPDPATTRPPQEGGWSAVPGAAPPGPPPPPPPQPYATWAPPLGAWGQPAAGPSAAPWTGPAVPPPLPVRPRPSRLPTEPVTYAQLLRGPTRAWWRPVLSTLVLLGLVGVFFVLPIPVVLAYGLLSGETTVEGLGPWLDGQLSLEGTLGPAGFLFTSLSLIVLIPAAMLAVLAVHRIRPGVLSSVAGRLRWRWLGRCVVVLSPLWVLYLVVSTLVDPPQSPRPEQWVVLLVMALLLTPGQAAAEEYVFRGWVQQNIGSLFARPVLAWVMPAVVGAAAFAAAHGSPDVWIVADLVLFSVVATVMTWRTGGLEAAIVMHAVNNLGVFAVTVTVGGWAEAFVGEETRSTPLAFGVSVVLHGVALALVWWQARRVGLDRWYRPAVGGPGVSAPRPLG